MSDLRRAVLDDPPAVSGGAARSDRIHEEYFGHEHVTVIEPSRGWRTVDLRELWAYRHLLWVLALRDVQVRYRQTALGVGWAVLRPLLTAVIFSLVFGRLARIPSDGYPYPLFVYAGLVPWMFFAQALSSSAQSLVTSSHLVSKVYFPRLVIPFASVLAGLVDLGVASAVLVAMTLWYGVVPGLDVLAWPLLVLAAALAALGVGTLLSAVAVAYRDVTHVVPFLLQLWLYLTPVIYPVTMIPRRLRWLAALNPLAGLVDAFRSAFLGSPWNLPGLAISAAVSVALLAVGLAYFERAERRFADVI